MDGEIEGSTRGPRGPKNLRRPEKFTLTASAASATIIRYVRGIRKTAVGSLERCNLESGIQTTRESLNSHSALAHVWPENISGV